MKISRSVSFLVVGASLALATLSMTGAAQAQNVSWSIGLSSPGMQVGVYNVPPPMVYLQPEPIYLQPEPIYVQPQSYYVQPQSYYVQPRRYYAPQPTVYVNSSAYLRADWRYPGHRRGGRHWQERQGEDRHEREHARRGGDRD